MAYTERKLGRASDAEAEMLLRGSVIRWRRKCGKAGCHCRTGEPHATWALSISVRGKTQILPLRGEDLPQVRAALARYRRAVAQLEKKVQRNVQRLRSPLRPAKSQEKEGRR